MTLETTDMQSLSRIARKNILDKLEKTLNGNLGIIKLIFFIT